MPSKLVLTDVNAAGKACIFLIDPLQLPEGYSAVVFVHVLEKTNWNKIGRLNNSIPVLFFQSDDVFDQIGIFLEISSDIEDTSNQMLALPCTALELGTRLFNYVCSFSRPASEWPSNSQVVPIKTIQEWYENISKRLSQQNVKMIK